jgi:hypothetical protein
MAQLANLQVLLLLAKHPRVYLEPFEVVEMLGKNTIQARFQGVWQMDLPARHLQLDQELPD